MILEYPSTISEARENINAKIDKTNKAKGNTERPNFSPNFSNVITNI